MCVVYIDNIAHSTILHISRRTVESTAKLFRNRVSFRNKNRWPGALYAT